MLFRSLPVIFFFFCLACCFNTRAQEYNFKHYGLPEGLSQAQITDICEDSKGFLWFATNGGGISRFDGLEFVTLSTEDNLPSNYIRCLYSDANHMYVGTQAGLSIYEYSTGTISTFRENEGLGNVVINDILACRDGLWLATNNGIFIYSKNSGFKHQLLLPQGSSQNVSQLEHGRQGQVLVGFNDVGFAIVDEMSKEVQSYFNEGNGTESSWTRALLQDGPITYVGTYGEGLFALVNDSLRRVPNTEKLLVNHIYNAGNQFWLATQKKGVLLLNKNDYSIENQLNVATGLPGNFITKIYNDSWGNTWIGTSGLGVVKKYAENISHYRELTGMTSTVIRDLEMTADSQILFSTNTGGLYELDNNVAQSIPILDRLKGTNIRCFIKDADGNFWLGTDGMGLYQQIGQRWRRYTSRRGISYGWIKDIIQDQYGKIWVASTGGGVYYNDNKRFYSFNQQEDILVERAECLLEDQKGNIWAGSRGSGLLKISGDSLEYHYTEFADKNIRSLAEDMEGDIFMGTDQGIFLLHTNSGETSFLGRNSGLYSTNIYSLETKGALLFIGHDHGVDVLDIATGKTIENYHYRNGFTGGECSQNAMVKDPYGNVWSGTLNGLSKIVLSSNANEQENKITLANAPRTFCFNEEVTPHFLSSYDDGSGNTTLPHEMNTFTYTMQGINQKYPDLVQFRWMLDGYEDSFSMAGSVNRVTYPQLPPGRYQFVYQAGINGNWSDTEKGPEIYISAPIWQRTWFKVSIALAVLLVLTAIVVQRIVSIKRKNRRREAQLKLERNLLDLQSKALQLQMNPHFIFNALNSVKGLIAIKDEKSAKLYLARFAKLMRLMLNNSREEWVPIQSELELIELYLSLENIAQQHPFSFNIHLDDSIDRERLQIPPMLIQPFVENAVKHAMRYKQGDGTIDIQLTQKGNKVICTVKDNGPGRNAVNKLQVDQNHQSLALTITNERLQMAGLSSEKAVMIEDLLENEKALGTLVTLNIPTL